MTELQPEELEHARLRDELRDHKTLVQRVTKAR